jgi:hypothetical protein
LASAVIGVSCLGILIDAAFENVASRGDGMSDLKAPTYKYMPSSGQDGRASIPSSGLDGRASIPS